SKVVDRVSVSRQCRLTPSDGMVGQDREEANRLQQAKWGPTSRIRDESNVPNAFHFSRRSRKRYSAETVPQPVTASQGTILCKAARNSVSWRCPIETAHCVAFLNTVRTEHFDQVLALRLDGANPRGARWARCGQRPEQSLFSMRKSIIGYEHHPYSLSAR